MSTHFNRYWIIVVSMLAICFIAGSVVLTIKLIKYRPTEIIVSLTNFSEYPTEIYIDGAVANPGIYPASMNDSIQDLVQAAGILTDINTTHLKLFIADMNSIDHSNTQKVNINRAETWLLEALPGIGQVKAQAIVDYRTDNGSFRRIEDLVKVEGISKTTLDILRNMITVEE